MVLAVAVTARSGLPVVARIIFGNKIFYFYFYFYFNLESETGYYRSEPIIVHIHKAPNLGPINFLRF